jgi:high-affinity K+ transport system ATPase subunit B
MQKNFGFNLQITLWLWFTVLFANFAEAMAEGRGKAQADTLRKARSETIANRLLPSGKTENGPGSKLRFGRCGDGAAGTNSFPAMARSSKASRRSMSRRSRANPRR